MKLRTTWLCLTGFFVLSMGFISPCIPSTQEIFPTPIAVSAASENRIDPDGIETLSQTDNLKQSQWWTQVQKNLQDQAYHISSQAPSAASDKTTVYIGTNRAHNIRYKFSQSRMNLHPGDEMVPTWQTDIAFESMGRGHQVVEAPPVAAARTDGPRIEFQRGTVVEWYENSRHGIEQGFTILEKPKGTDPLVIGLAVRGTARPVLSKEEESVDFVNPSGKKVLTYAKLHVFDSQGRVLSGRFDVTDQTIQIIVDDTQATYPIVVDPLFTAPEWSWANNATSVSTAGDINGDGYSDVIVGDAFYGTGGRVFVFYGSETGLGTSPDWQYGTAVENAWFGYSVATAGDIDGDGYSDVIVGAPNYANPTSFEGAAFVFFGSGSGLSSAPDWSAESNEFGASFGRSVATAGDVNGDGYSDVIIGASGSEYHLTGSAYVFLGSASGLGANGTPANADWTASVPPQGDPAIMPTFFGDAVATAGDVNGDGYSDILIGAPYYDDPTANEGKVFAYYGSATGLGAAGTPDNADWKRNGYGIASMYLGESVGTAGDVNGDGYSDVVVGGSGYSSSKGIVMAFLGSAGGLSTSYHRYYYGVVALDGLGSSVGTAGDVNGDGFADIIIGSEQSNAVHVVKGSATGLPATGQIPSKASWSQSQATSFGKSVATAGDVDGDGLSDVIAGGAAAYVYSGSFPGIESEPSQIIDGEADYRHVSDSMNAAGDINADGYQDIIIISGGNANVYFGSAAGVNTASPDQTIAVETGGPEPAGDVNGDGYGDVIFHRSSYGSYGAAFVYYGSASGLSGSYDIVVGDANQGEVCFGDVAASAGDVNGDGYDDILVSAPIYDFAGGREGAVFLYLGSSTGLVTTPAWDVFGQEASNRYGTAVGSAGDVNNDGYDDFFVTGNLNGVQGMFVYYGDAGGPSETASWTAVDTIYSAATAGDVNDDGFADIVVGDSAYSETRGRVAVFHGSPSGLDLNGTRPVGNFASADWTIAASTPDGYFGYVVSSAGDANRDGYSDILVGQPFWWITDVSGGKAYIYYGSASGITSANPWSYECSQLNADFGEKVVAAGDINGDGFSDMIIGAGEYTDTNPLEGRIFFFYGNDGGGSSMPLPEQLETDYYTPIEKTGLSDSETAFVFKARGRPPFGRGKIKVECEVKPAGQPFDGTGTFTSSTWTNSGIDGVLYAQKISGLVGHTPYRWRIRFRFKPDNPMGLSAGAWQVPFAEGHAYFKTNNTPPVGGYATDNIIPTDAGQVVQSTQESQSGVMTVHFRLKDAGINDCSLHSFQYSVDGGSTWKTPTGGDDSGSLGGGWPDNDGDLYGSATDWSGPVHFFIFGTKDPVVAADFEGVDQSDVRVRFVVNDGLQNSVSPVTSNAFRVDNAPPATGTIVISDNSGTTADATPLLTLSSSGADYMRFALSEGGLSSASWVPYASTYSAFNIGAGSNGSKTVWVEYRDQYWNIQAVHTSDTTIYDTSPGVSGEAATYDTTPVWTWTSSGEGSGTFRYKLDDSNLEESATVTSNTSYTPSQVLSEGLHTLYVQEWNTAGYWGNTGSFTIEIDSGKPCSAATSPAAVDDLNQTFTITYTHDDIYAGEACGSAGSGSGLATVDLYARAPGEDTFSLVDTDSDGDIDGQFSFTAGPQGAYDFYTLATDKAGNVELSTGSDSQTIFASQFSGYAILSVGAISGEEGIEAHTLTANNVYKHLINRNFALVNGENKWLDPLDHIKYYNPYAILQPGEDDYSAEGPDYWNAMRKAITQWALHKMTVLPGPLYIVLIDHGTPDKFYLESPMYVTSSELNSWLDTLESGLAAEGVYQDIVVILGTCYSGSFIDDLSGPGRIIVASSAADEPSYRGPMEPSGIRDGEFFISSLFNELGKGSSLQSSFLNAVDRIEIHTDSGTTNSVVPYFDVAMQHPFLDDNNDGIGSHEIGPGSDGDRSETVFLGYATTASQPVAVTDVIGYPDTLVAESSHSALLWAKVSDATAPPESVWVEVRKPGTILEGGVEQQLVDLDEITLTLNGDRYEATYNSFWWDGRYTLFFYAKDASGLISPFKRSYAYRETSGNSAPDSFSLVSPANSATVPIALVLDWEDAHDTVDGDAVSYIVTVSTNPDLGQSADWVYREEGLDHSSVSLSADDGLQNSTTYHWGVTAVDEYGAAVESAVWSFTTDAVTNPVAGWIKGFVYNDVSGEFIDSAVVSLSSYSLNSALNGYYLGILTAGLYDDVYISAPGYETAGPLSVTVPEGGIVTRNFGLTPAADLQPTAVIVSPETNVFIAEGEAVDFQGSVSSGDAPVTFLWDFDGGAANSTQEDPGSVVFPAAGVYTVTFTATDNDGDWDDDSVIVTVTEPDLCPGDPAKIDPGVCGCGTPDTDTDGDGDPDCVDLDDDDDGMPDDWEETYGLNPLKDDADADADHDGYTNLEEYEQGSNPVNRNDPDAKAMPWLPILLE